MRDLVTKNKLGYNKSMFKFDLKKHIQFNEKGYVKK